MPNYPDGGRSYSGYLYRCPDGHEHVSDEQREGPVICQHCSTSARHIRMTLVRDSDQ